MTDSPDENYRIVSKKYKKKLFVAPEDSTDVEIKKREVDDKCSNDFKTLVIKSINGKKVFNNLVLYSFSGRKLNIFYLV